LNFSYCFDELRIDLIPNNLGNITNNLESIVVDTSRTSNNIENPEALKPTGNPETLERTGNPETLERTGNPETSKLVDNPDPTLANENVERVGTRDTRFI
jgi:hypothetical protein